MKNLSEEEARQIYFHRYAKRYEKINDVSLKVFLTDYAVNSGHDDAIMALQTGLKNIGAYSQIVDGVWGNKTDEGVRVLNSLNPVNSSRVYKAAYSHRQDKYINLVVNDKQMRKLMEIHGDLQIHNLRGWMNRLKEFL